MLVTPNLHHDAAVLEMGPIAASLAQQLGYKIDPFLMAVAFGAGSDFLSPIGHQSNTLVMGLGGYRFGDYWKLGLPLSVMVVVLGVPLIMLVWSPRQAWQGRAPPPPPAAAGNGRRAIRGPRPRPLRARRAIVAKTSRREGSTAISGRISGRAQILLALLSIFIFLLDLVPLELQRRIVNDAIGEKAFRRRCSGCAASMRSPRWCRGSGKLTWNVYRNSGRRGRRRACACGPRAPSRRRCATPA